MADTIVLEELSAEIIDRFLQYLPKNALANLRLASRTLHHRATPFLFRQLTLRCSSTSAANAGEIVHRPYLVRLVRGFRFETTRSAWYYASMSTHESVWRVTKDLPFYHLDSLSIAFGGTLSEALMGSTYANNILSTVLTSFKTSPFPRPPPPRLSSLSIENFPSDYMTIVPVFSKLLHNIRRLEFSTIIVEHKEYDPNKKQLFRGAMTFYAQLPPLLLAPASQNLAVLHLSADSPWGWYPKIDFRRIHFPLLEDLMLSRFTFSHDWQMEWLLDHAGSLRRLSLIRCAILDHATSTGQHFDRDGYPRRREPDQGGTSILGSYHYQRRWSYYFLEIASFLPHLQAFSLLTPDHVIRYHHPQDVLSEEVEQGSRAHDRYVKYASMCCTPLFTHWPGHNTRMEQMKQDREDTKALRKLLAVIEQRNRKGT